MNYYVLNTQGNPLYIMDPFVAAATAGTAYSIYVPSVSVASGGTIGIRIANSSGSGKLIYINNIYTVSSGSNVAGSITLYKGATLGSPGTLTSFNTNLGASQTSIAVTQYQGPDATVSGGTIFDVATQITSVYNNIYGGTVIIQPNNSLTILITNSQTSSSSIYAKVNYWEQNI